MNYPEKIAEILGYSEHSSLRTVFDPYSHEWSRTTMEEKVAILKKIVLAGIRLDNLVMEYQLHYSDVNPPVAKDVTLGLAQVMDAMLRS